VFSESFGDAAQAKGVRCIGMFATLLLIAGIVAAAPEGGVKHVFPLSPGTTWTYSGDVRWTVSNTNHVRRARVGWQTRIVSARNSGATTAAVVSGFPFDLAWYEPQQKPGYAVLIENPRGVFVKRVNGKPEAEAFAQRAIAGEERGKQILRYPVRIGDCVSDDSEPRVGEYCWSVERRIREARGVAWEIVHRTGADHQILHIVPGVGITSYVYEHHGTVSSANVRLSKFVLSAK